MFKIIMKWKLGQVEVECLVNEEGETQNSSKNPLGKHMAYVQIYNTFYPTEAILQRILLKYT